MKQKITYGLALLFTLLPFILISKYNHPSDDDYCTYQLFHSMAFMDSLVYGYQNFTGRFTFLLLYGQLDPLYASDWLLWTRIWPILVLSSLLVSLFVFIQSLAKTQSSSGEKFLIFTVLVVLIFQGMPFIASLLYWFTGATVYTVALSLLLISISLFIITLRSDNALMKIGAFMLANLLAVLAVGSNETMMSFLIPFLLVLGFLFWKNGDKSSFVYTIIFLAVIIVAAGFALAAPGNFRRATDMMGISFSASYFIKAGIKCVYLVGLHIVGWLSQLQIWIAALILVPIVNRWEFGVLHLKTWTGILLAHLAVFGILVSCALLSCLAYNDVLPRIFNILFVVFVFCFIYLIVLLRRKLEPLAVVQQIFSIPGKYAISVFLFFFVLCAVSFKSNISIAWMDLAFKAREYDERLLSRYNEIEKSKADGQDSVLVAALFDKQYKYPKTLFVNDLTRNPAGFPNSCLSHFFKLKSIKLDDCPTIESKHLE